MVDDGTDDGDVDRPTLLYDDNICLLPAFLAAPPFHHTLELGGKHDKIEHDKLENVRLEHDNL